MLCLYAASFTDKSDAISLVRDREGLLDDGDKVGDAYPLSKLTIESLGIEPGEATLL